MTLLLFSFFFPCFFDLNVIFILSLCRFFSFLKYERVFQLKAIVTCKSTYLFLFYEKNQLFTSSIYRDVSFIF